jgi:hypothetical protein
MGAATFIALRATYYKCSDVGVPKENEDALDDFCGVVGVVAGWLGELSRDWRVHPHFIGAGVGRVAYPVDQRPATGGLSHHECAVLCTLHGRDYQQQ